MSEEHNISIEPEKVSLINDIAVETPLINLTDIAVEIPLINLTDIVIEPEKISLINDVTLETPYISLTDIVTELVEIVLTDATDVTIDNSVKNIITDLSGNNLKTDKEFYLMLMNILNGVDIVPKININPDILHVILELDIEAINDIYKSILEIVKDNKIDSKDIPQFILLIERIHKLIVNLKCKDIKAKNRIEITELFIKFIFNSLAEKGIIGDIEKNVELLREIDALIDACIRLLNFTIDIDIASKPFVQKIKKFLCFRK